MKARIKKGVRPFGGRVFPILEEKTLANDRKVVVVNVGARGQMGLHVADQRQFDRDEVELILERGDTVDIGDKVRFPKWDKRMNRYVKRFEGLTGEVGVISGGKELYVRFVPGIDGAGWFKYRQVEMVEPNPTARERCILI